MDEGRLFHLGDVLTVTTGRLLSPTHVNGLYAILNFMTRDNLYTHQLGRAADECKPHLLAQFPALSTENTSAVTEFNWRQWLDGAVQRHGEWHLVKPLPEHAHEFIDQISELAEKVHPSKIILVK